MKTISLEVSDELFDAISSEPSAFQRAATRELERERKRRTVQERLELVKTITRCKARVWNWGDLEREIFEGSI